MKNVFSLSIAAVALLTCGAAEAQSFTGATVNYQYYFPTSVSPYPGAANGNYVVGPGVEVSNVADGRATMDISANNILINFLNSGSWTSSAFNGWVLSDQTNNLATILGVTVNPATNMAGFSNSNVSFTGDSISVNWQGLNFDENTVVSLDVALGDSAVPEPATWAMMLIGFGAMGIAMRRGRKQPAVAKLA